MSQVCDVNIHALNSCVSAAVIILKVKRCHARIQEFSSGGAQVNLTKKALTLFFSPQLILQKSNG